jgi:hypothetical protein
VSKQGLLIIPGIVGQISQIVIGSALARWFAPRCAALDWRHAAAAQRVTEPAAEIVCTQPPFSHWPSCRRHPCCRVRQLKLAAAAEQAAVAAEEGGAGADSADGTKAAADLSTLGSKSIKSVDEAGVEGQAEPLHASCEHGQGSPVRSTP